VLPDGLQFDTLIASTNRWPLNDSGDVAFVACAISPPISFHGDSRLGLM
jgi:hypothetical protein